MYTTVACNLRRKSLTRILVSTSCLMIIIREMEDLFRTRVGSSRFTYNVILHVPYTKRVKINHKLKLSFQYHQNKSIAKEKGYAFVTQISIIYRHGAVIIDNKTKNAMRSRHTYQIEKQCFLI